MITPSVPLLSEISRFWICSIVGEKGSGKDLLACEIAAMGWLCKPHNYKFYSNQFSVWNDPIYRDPVNDYEADRVVRGGVNAGKYVDIRKRVCVLSEGGRYLREYKYFEDLMEFARKIKTVFFFPSDRPPHADLMRLHLAPVIRFEQVVGVLGGVWMWKVETGWSRPRTGQFTFLPGSKYVGVYDTQDFTENPDFLLQAVRDAIEIDQRLRGRNGVQSVGGSAEVSEMDAQITFQKRIEQYTLSLPKQGQRR